MDARRPAWIQSTPQKQLARASRRKKGLATAVAMPVLAPILLGLHKPFSTPTIPHDILTYLYSRFGGSGSLSMSNHC